MKIKDREQAIQEFGLDAVEWYERGKTLSELQALSEDYCRGSDDGYRHGYYKAMSHVVYGIKPTKEYLHGPLYDWMKDKNEETADNPPSPRKIKYKSKLRFQIFKRDGYRCQVCGVSAQDNAVLHVDHKIPRSKGGTDNPKNLWTLCQDCNLGKGVQSL